MANDYMGNPGQKVPEITDEIVTSISNRYIELYESIIGETFIKAETADIIKRIETNVLESLKRNSLI
jgi:phosphoribosylaminoimidazole-succinocarboxamide synthase